MKALLLNACVSLSETKTPLAVTDVSVPLPADNEILIKISACAVCHTELDEIEGRTPPPRLPIIPGHQVVGTVASRGAAVSTHAVGDRVGVAWIYSAWRLSRLP